MATCGERHGSRCDFPGANKPPCGGLCAWELDHLGRCACPFHIADPFAIVLGGPVALVPSSLGAQATCGTRPATSCPSRTACGLIKAFHRLGLTH
eukprot:7123622-Heterocapsa_arctica.AAC.1